MTELANTTRTPATIGQATAVEQARAEAEVKAAVVVAQQCPRDVAGARNQMVESCQQIELAQRAFFRYRRGTSQITGPTIHLARELARCWGNVQYGIAEMRRDDVAGESEMLAFAWDVQTNTRNTSTFIVPHVRDKQGGGTKLTDVRDIYENNANMGARRVREAIFAILPPWFTEQAKSICNATIEQGDGTPLEDRIGKVIEGYARANITKRQLEEKVGLRAENWTARDVAALTVVWRSLVARETTKEEEFPSPTAPPADASAAERMTAALRPSDPQEPAAGPAQGTDSASPEPEPASLTPEPSGSDEGPAAAAGDPGPSNGKAGDATSSTVSSGSGSSTESVKDATQAQLRKMHMLFGSVGLGHDDERPERMAAVVTIVGREVDSTNELNSEEASTLIDTLSRCKSREDLDLLLQGIRDAEAEHEHEDES